MKRDIGEILLDSGQITDEEFKQALQAAENTSEPKASLLLRLGLVTEANLKTVLELHYGVKYLDLKKAIPDTTIISLLPHQLVLQYELVPVQTAGNRLTLAMVNPADEEALNKAKDYLQDWQLGIAVCTDEGFQHFIIKAYGAPPESGEEYAPVESGYALAEPRKNVPAESEYIRAEPKKNVPAESEYVREEPKKNVPAESEYVREEPKKNVPAESEYIRAEPEGYASVQPEYSQAEPKKYAPAETMYSPTSPEKVADNKVAFIELMDSASTDSPVIEDQIERSVDENRAIVLLSHHIIANAISKGCTNIHIEPNDRQVLVHYRKEGVLFAARRLPRSILPELVQRFKIMAAEAADEVVLPYDGLLNVRHGQTDFSFRLSIIPGAFGEHLVIWLG